MNWVIDDPFNRALLLGGIFGIGEGGKSLKIAIIPRSDSQLTESVGDQKIYKHV